MSVTGYVDESLQAKAREHVLAEGEEALRERVECRVAKLTIGETQISRIIGAEYVFILTICTFSLGLCDNVHDFWWHRDKGRR
jgi:hypothetical protein